MVSEIIVPIIIIILGLVIFKITKSIAKAIFFAVTLLTVIIAVAGFFIVSDSLNFKESFSSQPSLYLLDYNGDIVAGFSGIFTEETQPSLISDGLIGSYNSDYQSGDLENILGDNYKLFIIKDSAFVSLDEVYQGDIKFTKQEIYDLIRSSETIDDYIKSQNPEITSLQLPLARQQLMEQIDVSDDAEMRGLLFGLLFSSSIEQEGALFIFNKYSDENIMIYPETIMFKALKRLPLDMVTGLINIEGVKN